MIRERRGEDPEEDYRNAVADCTEALRRQPGLLDARDCRGWAHHLQGKYRASRGGNPAPLYEKALADYDGVIARNPAMWRSRVRKGLLFEETGRFHEAAKAYEKAIEVTGGKIPVLKTYLARARARAEKRK